MSQIDLSSIDQKLLLARGQYATVRAAREDSLKVLQQLCSQLQVLPHGILKTVQDGETVDSHLSAIDMLSEKLKAQVATVLDLTAQKDALKPEAWGKS